MANAIYRSLGRPGPVAGFQMPTFGGPLSSNGVFNRGDVSDDSENMYVEQQYSTPSIGYNHFAEMREGMLAFCVRVDPGDKGATFIVVLHQLNRLFREQWDDFVISTTGDATNNPRFDGHARKFLTYMQNFGEHGLSRYETVHCSGNARELAKLEDLREYWDMAKSDQFCYLTLFGILQRVSYLGPITNLTRSYTLDVKDYHDAGYQGIVVGLGQRVPCTQVFGRSEQLTPQVKLHLTYTRIPCSDGKYGAFWVMPGSEFDDHAKWYRDESGTKCCAYKRNVGSVHTAATKQNSSFAILQATNMAPALAEDSAWRQHSGLPFFFLNCGV